MDSAGFGPLAATAARTAIVLLALAAGVRIFGKRHLGEMNVYDILMVLVMANAVQNAMTKGDGALAVALVSAGTLILGGWLVAALMGRWPSVEERLMGSPVVIVQEGRLVATNLRRAKISADEVMSAVRKQGLADLEDVKLAVLEMDGSISVVPREKSGEVEGGAKRRA